MADQVYVAIGEAQRKVEKIPTDPIKSLTESGTFVVDRAINQALATKGINVLRAFNYAQSLGCKAAKLVTQSPDGQVKIYFLKIVPGETGSSKCEAEYESLKAIHAVSPAFSPSPLVWGRCEEQSVQSSFLVEDFREIGSQPADPSSLARRLADLHNQSRSPTGEFGFHIKTWHGEIAQDVAQWDRSWAALFGRHLGHILDIARFIVKLHKFDILCELTLSRVVPRLLCPLQDGDRVLKPCLLHGDCWDGNTALDATTGEAFIFDVCSFYGHNEYDIGNWRAPRHRLSNRAYVEAYKAIVPPSEPVEEWGSRNLLYSLPFNTGNLINIPHSREAEVIHEDIETLCRMLCPDDLNRMTAEAECNRRPPSA